MKPGAWLTGRLACLHTAVIAGQAKDAVKILSASTRDSDLEAILSRTSQPRMKVHGTSLRRNLFFVYFDSSAAETGNEVGTGYVENSVGQRSKSMNSSLVVVPRHSAGTSSRNAEATSASRLIDSKGLEVQPMGALMSRNKTGSRRNTEEAIHNAEKFILDKMASSSSAGKTSNPSKNGSAQAFVSPPMSRSRKERQPAVLLEDHEINGRVMVAVSTNSNGSSEIRMDKDRNGSYSGTGDTEPVSGDWTYEVRLENGIITRLFTKIGTVVILTILITIIVLLLALVISNFCFSCLLCMLCCCHDEL